jgi:hypothetical protein
MPAQWLSSEIWTYHVQQKTRELVRSEPFWSIYAEAVEELERQAAGLPADAAPR